MAALARVGLTRLARSWRDVPSVEVAVSGLFKRTARRRIRPGGRPRTMCPCRRMRSRRRRGGKRQWSAWRNGAPTWGLGFVGAPAVPGDEATAATEGDVHTQASGPIQSAPRRARPSSRPLNTTGTRPSAGEGGAADRHPSGRAAALAEVEDKAVARTPHAIRAAIV